MDPCRLVPSPKSHCSDPPLDSRRSGAWQNPADYRQCVHATHTRRAPPPVALRALGVSTDCCLGCACACLSVPRALAERCSRAAPLHAMSCMPSLTCRLPTIRSYMAVIWTLPRILTIILHVPLP